MLISGGDPVYICDRGNDGTRVFRKNGEFGHQSRWAGGFYAAHSIGIDSSSNLYIGETWEGKRVQKFTYKGLGARAR